MKKREAIVIVAEGLVKAYPGFRPGQAIFNAAFQLFPQEADRWRGSEVDPFHFNERIDLFLEQFEAEVNYEDFQN